MSITRTFDATAINAVLNHPEVFPSVAEHGTTEPLDLGPLMADSRNVMLMGTDGGVFFHWQEPGVYIAHTSFRPGESRGERALSETREACWWMFTHTDAVELLSFAPVTNRAAALWAIAANGEADFERPEAWKTANGRVTVRHYALRFPRWVRKDRRVATRGRWFHERLEAEKLRHGVTEPLHSPDMDHERHVGAAFDMIVGAQETGDAAVLGKAFLLYNRYARTAGYQQVRLVSGDPIIIDQGDALIMIKGDEFEVLKCR